MYHQAAFNEKVLEQLEMQNSLNKTIVELLERNHRRIQQIEQRLDALEQAQKNVEFDDEAYLDLRLEQYEKMRQNGDFDLEPGDMSEAYAPNLDVFCQKCDGTGWVTVYDSVPYGIGNVQMPSDNACECWTSDEPHCPKCGGNIRFLDEEDAFCLRDLSCGWVSNTERYK